jgi:hypothetical protein
MKNHHSAVSRKTPAENSDPNQRSFKFDVRFTVTPLQMCRLRNRGDIGVKHWLQDLARAGLRLHVTDFSIENRSGRALRPWDGRTGSVRGSLFWMDPHSRTLHCKVIMAAAEKIYRRHGADERTKPGRCMDPAAGLEFIDRTDREIHPERALGQRTILHG